MDDLYYAPGMPTDDREDHIVKAIALKGHVKATAIRSTAAVQKMMEIHNTTPAVTAALGRFISASLLIAENMKNDDDTQTTIIKCDGSIKGMTCVCDSHGNARCYPNENEVETTYYYPGKINVAQAVGNGTLTVIRDIGLRDPFVGTVELVSGEIAEDFTYYLASSEQTPSIVALGVLLKDGHVEHAGGMVIQLMPGYTEEDVVYLEERVNGGFPEITFLMEEGLSPAKMLDMFLGDPDITYMSGYPISYKCNCSKERMSNGIAALGKSEVKALAEDEAGITTECHFCNSKYHFSSDELKKMLEEI